VVTQGDQQFDMRESETGWHLNQGFYVRMDSLYQWVQALRNARLIEAKTANPDNFSALSLTEDDLRVRLYQDQQLLADVILGQPSNTPGARFIRYTGDNQSWLASGLNDLSSSQDVWQLTMIFDVPETQVQAIEWTAQEALNLIRDGETGQWLQADKQSETMSLDQDKVNALAASLSGFRIQDAIETTSVSVQPRQTFVFGLEQGRKITLAVYGDEEDAFIKVTDSQQPERYQSWQFTMPDYKLSTIFMDQAAVVNPQIENSDNSDIDLIKEPESGL